MKCASLMKIFGHSELILNPDGSVYHLHLLPEHIGNTIILVGDPGRVKNVSRHFDKIETQVENREFVTHTGYIGAKKITCISTGIGTDNIDIVLNELDALVNIDLVTRTEKAQHQSLEIVRIGTTGSLQAEIPVDAWIVSGYAFGLDGLMNYYRFAQTAEQKAFIEAFIQQVDYPAEFSRPYSFKGADHLVSLFSDRCTDGITLTAPGFYAPQGRSLRFELAYPSLMDRFAGFHFQGRKITNFEMETSGIYGLGTLLGHHICSLSAVVANRSVMEFSTDPYVTVDALIKFTLEKLSSR